MDMSSFAASPALDIIVIYFLIVKTHISISLLFCTIQFNAILFNFNPIQFNAILFFFNQIQS